MYFMHIVYRWNNFQKCNRFYRPHSHRDLVPFQFTIDTSLANISVQITFCSLLEVTTWTSLQFGHDTNLYCKDSIIFYLRGCLRWSRDHSGVWVIPLTQRCYSPKPQFSPWGKPQSYPSTFLYKLIWHVHSTVFGFAHYE